MTNTKPDFNAAADAAEIRELQAQQRYLHRRRVFRHKSRLDAYAAQLVELRRDHGMKFSELQTWLQRKRGLKVARTTVMRWFRKNYADLCQE